MVMLENLLVKIAGIADAGPSSSSQVSAETPVACLVKIMTAKKKPL
jgi:hypothetical protein